MIDGTKAWVTCCGVVASMLLGATGCAVDMPNDDEHQALDVDGADSDEALASDEEAASTDEAAISMPNRTCPLGYQPKFNAKEMSPSWMACRILCVRGSQSYVLKSAMCRRRPPPSSVCTANTRTYTLRCN